MRNKVKDLKKSVSDHVGSSSPTSAETAMRNKARRAPKGAILLPRWLSPSKATRRNKVEERRKEAPGPRWSHQGLAQQPGETKRGDCPVGEIL
ncbi:hypothetical protein GMDG_00602 [Pseudogymnoascus destructans 20631-21]|uniref:Uncharacterized protein n=1 Tax=Pseudogymnoascus destructans (strain ATCC MYA-4855 / 20631-21) TaxID=658429 RepID=L8G7Y1_PSED2|nr:hypothetical protein GMDG_00602 [Pseudogymnoascus destructans 20631-21]